jgi:hypothetical protein
MQRFRRLLRDPIRSRQPTVWAPLLAAALWAALPGLARAEPAVGRVTMLIGDARVVRADGQSRVLAAGAEVHAGDRVETGANGHVHLRFVDNGSASVRPDSSLELTSYRFDARRPQEAEVRLRVDKGTARSISGDATATDKSRFRLNTPIAAIGVRGTDFVVQTDSRGVRATVADGAIVVSPFGEGCNVGALGPCLGLDGRELTAAMGRVMAELRVGERSTQLVPASEIAMATAVMSANRNGIDRQSWAAAVESARASGLLAAEPSSAQQQRGNDFSAAELLTLAAVTVPNIDRAPRLDAQLVWGRWSIAPAPTDKLTVPFTLARLDRHVTVADLESGLFRRNPAAGGELFPTELAGRVEFRLDRASATYESGNGIESALVRASNLTLDFGRRTFATALDLATASGVRGELRVAGEVRADGLFAVSDANQRVAGAVSVDGKEAGYLFETGRLGDLFRGRTLWSSGP